MKKTNQNALLMKLKHFLPSFSTYLTAMYKEHTVDTPSYFA